MIINSEFICFFNFFLIFPDKVSMTGDNFEANNLAVFEHKFFIKITTVYLLYSLIFSCIYFYLGALLTSYIMFSSSIFLSLIIYYLEFKNFSKSARMLLLFASLISCLSPVIGIQKPIGIEYYFLSFMLAPAVFFKAEEKICILAGQSLSILAWIYTVWGVKPNVPLAFQPIDFPTQLITYCNYVGAAGVVVIVIRFLVTRQQDSIKKMEKSNIRQELFLEGANLGAWDWWLVSDQVYYDARWFKILGIDSTDVNHNLETRTYRIHPEDIEKNIKDIQDYFSGKTSSYQSVYRMTHANGNWIWILDRGKISEYNESGKPIRFTGTYYDITSLKEIEVLNHTVQRLACIGGWELDAKNLMTKWTDEVYRIHALPVGMSLDLINAINYYAPHEREKITSLVSNCIKGIPYNEILELVDADNKKKWVKVTGIPVFDAQSHVVKIHGTIQDVSELILAEMTAKSERIKSNQNSKLASLGELSAGVAHEINNPLAVISAANSSLPKYIHDPEKLIQKIELINKSVKRITKIVSGLKKFSRSAEQSSYSLISLNDIIHETIDLTSYKASKYQVNIELDLQSNAKILCNEIEIEQVLVNLINNAIEANKENIEKWIKVILHERNHILILQIIDSGKGIPEDIQAKLFDPFFTTKGIGEGTGLGLSISKGILEEHKASIEILDDVPNTTFEIKFLIAEDVGFETEEKAI